MTETLADIKARVPDVMAEAQLEAETLLTAQYRRGVPCDISVVSLVVALAVCAGSAATDQDEVNQRVERMVNVLRGLATPLGKMETTH